MLPTAGGILLPVFGVALLAWGGSKTLAWRRRMQWPRTSGRVITTLLSGTNTVKVDFEFTPAGGLARQARREEPFADEAGARRFARRFPEGGMVPVYYSQDGEAALDRSPGAFPFLAAMGLVLILGGIAIEFQARGRERAAAGAGVVAGSLLLVFAGGLQRHRTGLRRNWRSTSGRIVRSEVRKLGFLPDALSRWDDQEAVIAYRYTVDGVEMTGSTVTTDDYRNLQSETGRPGVAEGMVGRYPAGAGVEVWYCPADPWDALLELPPSVSGLALAIGAVGAAFLVACGGVLTGAV